MIRQFVFPDTKKPVIVINKRMLSNQPGPPVPLEPPPPLGAVVAFTTKSGVYVLQSRKGRVSDRRMFGFVRFEDQYLIGGAHTSEDLASAFYTPIDAIGHFVADGFDVLSFDHTKDFLSWLNSEDVCGP